MMTVISVKNLFYTYPQGKTVLQDVSFALEEGVKLAIVGTNGSGKSTLLLHLNGILHDRGEVFVDGLDINKQNQARIRTLIGMVFQNPDDQLFSGSVFDDVAFGPIYLGFKKDAVKNRVMKALKTVHMETAANRNPFQLSGGEKKRVAIASVLSMDPKILILDEPSAGLDALARDEIIALLASMPHTMVIATHDLELAKTICSRTILLHEGKVAETGPTASILNDTEKMLNYGLI